LIRVETDFLRYFLTILGQAMASIAASAEADWQAMRMRLYHFLFTLLIYFSVFHI